METTNQDAERDERRVLRYIARDQATKLHPCGCFDLQAEVFKLPVHREAFSFLKKQYPRYVQPNAGPVLDLITELRAEAAEPIDGILAIVDRIRERAEYEHSASARNDQCRQGADNAHAHFGRADAARDAAPRVISSPSRSTGRVTTGELFKKEQNQLRGELRVFYHWTNSSKGKVTDEGFESFVERLRGQLAPKDPLDPNSVSPQELGAHFHLTFVRRRQIEEKETARRAPWHKKWPCRYPKPPLFRFHKIGVDPADISPQQVAGRYKTERGDRYNAERRTKRKHKREIMQGMYLANGYVPYDVRLTKNGIQRENLYQAVTAADMTVASLVIAMQSNPAWLGLSDDQLYRAVLNRLDDLQRDKKICSRLVAGPRGSRQRLVTRI